MLWCCCKKETPGVDTSTLWQVTEDVSAGTYLTSPTALNSSGNAEVGSVEPFPVSSNQDHNHIALLYYFRSQTITHPVTLVRLSFDLDVTPGFPDALYAYAKYDNTVDFTSREARFTIYGAAEDDWPGLGASPNFNDTIWPSTPRTSNFVDVETEVINNQQTVASPQKIDVTAIFNEVIGRPGWEQGNSVGFLLEDNQSDYVWLPTLLRYQTTWHRVKRGSAFLEVTQ